MTGVLGTLLGALVGAGRWWLEELAGCLPARLRNAFARDGQSLVIGLEPDRARFERHKGRATRALGDVALTDGAAGDKQAAVRRLLRRAGLRSAELVLRLQHGKVLRRTVDLPVAALENLREVIGFEMDRHTPFKSSEVYYDYRVLGHEPDLKRIKVDLVVAPRAAVDGAVSLVRGWGLEPDRLEAADDTARPWKANLLPQGDVKPPEWRRLTGVLVVAAAVMLAVAIYLPLMQKQEVLAAAEARLASARAAALQADALKQQVGALAGRSSFVVEQKRARLTVTELLDEITRLLPDDTWVLQFGRRGEQITLSGYTTKSSALIGLLEASQALEEVRFSSPVTADPRVERDRFNITAAVAARGAK